MSEQFERAIKRVLDGGFSVLPGHRNACDVRRVPSGRGNEARRVAESDRVGTAQGLLRWEFRFLRSCGCGETTGLCGRKKCEHPDFLTNFAFAGCDRTTMNFQYREGMTSMQALRHLYYTEGGTDYLIGPVYIPAKDSNGNYNYNYWWVINF